MTAGETKTRPKWDVTFFVWAVFGLMFVVAMTLCISSAPPLPIQDMNDVVPQLTGHAPVDVDWLWSRHNEHRIPLPKLLLLGLVLPTGDLRTPALFNVLAMASLAWLFVRQAGRLRGEPRYTDAFFPLTLLHLGQASVFLQGFNITSVAQTCLLGFALILVTRQREGHPSRRSWLAFSACLMGLPLCGGGGLLVVPPLASWLALVAWERIRSKQPEFRREGRWMMVASLLPLSLCGLWLIGLESVSEQPPGEGIIPALRTALQFCAMSLGPGGAYPLSSGVQWPAGGWLVISLVIVAMVACGSDWASGRNGHAAKGLLLFAASLACLALAIGWGRAGFGAHAGLQLRYTPMAVPIVCWIYLAGIIHGRAAGRLLQVTLFAVACAVLAPNAAPGMAQAKRFNESTSLVLQAVRSNATPAQISSRYWKRLHADTSESYVTEKLRMLEAAGIGPYSEALMHE